MPVLAAGERYLEPQIPEATDFSLGPYLTTFCYPPWLPGLFVCTPALSAMTAHILQEESFPALSVPQRQGSVMLSDVHKTCTWEEDYEGAWSRCCNLSTQKL